MRRGNRKQGMSKQRENRGSKVKRIDSERKRGRRGRKTGRDRH